MALFSLIGTALGGLIGKGSGAALASAVGGALGASRDNKKAAKDYNRVEANKFVRLRAAAEKGGFHPLEALRAGEQVGARTGRLVSALAANNAYDALAEELTGDAAKRRKREEVEDEIRERELERITNSMVNTPTVKTNTPFVPTKRPPSRPPLLGAPAGLDNVESGRETVTGPRDLDGEAFNDPTRGDFAMHEERYGDNEILNAPLIGEQMWNDVSYRSSLAFSAQRLGMTEWELHAKIIENPRLRDQLPGVIARTTITAQELWQYLTKNLEMPQLPNNGPKSYRLAPSTNHSLMNR